VPGRHNRAAQRHPGNGCKGYCRRGTEEQVAAVAETEPAAAEPAAETPGKGRVVIQPGNNLWQISRVIYGKGVQYTVIYEANKDQIRNPDLIYPGQIFETPGSQAPESIDPDCRKPLAECEPQNRRRPNRAASGQSFARPAQ
jgi:hypothetical protein